MKAEMLGMPLVFWGWVAWVAIAGVFGLLVWFRVLFTVKESDELFIGPAELERTAQNRHQITVLAKIFGGVAGALLVVLVIGTII